MSRIYTFAELKQEFRDRWRAMVVIPARSAEFNATAARLYRNIATYRQVEKLTGVPAVVVMVIHSRECDGNMAGYLGNGQPWSRVTTEVPAGRGPFASFVDGAVDALHYDGLANITDWSIERALYSFEAYNGEGYRQYHNEASPYVWGGTNQQTVGKYVSDGQFDPNVMDSQPGCAPLMAALFTLDPTLRLPMADGSGPVVTLPAIVQSAKPPIPTMPPDYAPPTGESTPATPVTPTQTAVGVGLVALGAAVAAAWHSIITFLQHLIGG
jgi:lysozyme family protein